MEVQPLAVFAFRTHYAQNISHTEIRIHCTYAPGLFHTRAYTRFTYSWLSSKEALTQTNVARVQPLSHNGLAYGEHIRGSSTYSVDLQLADGVDQQHCLTHSKGYDGGSCGLQVLMV